MRAEGEPYQVTMSEVLVDLQVTKIQNFLSAKLPQPRTSTSFVNISPSG